MVPGPPSAQLPRAHWVLGYMALLKFSCAEVRSHYLSFHFALADKMFKVSGEIPSGVFGSLELL